MSFLSNKWEKRGNNIDDFFTNLKLLDEKKKSISLNTSDLTLYSIADKKNEILSCFVLKPFNIYKKYKASSGIILGLQQRNLNIPSWLKVNEKETHELLKDTYLNFGNKLLIGVKEEEPYFVSMEAIRQLGRILWFAGQTINNASLERDVLLAKLCENDIDINLVIATNNGVNKIMAVLPGDYIYEPQMIIYDIYENIEKQFKEEDIKYSWHICHDNVSLSMKINDNISINIINSNQGNEALGIKICIDSHEYKILKKHKVRINANDINLEINKILKEYINKTINI